MYGMLLQWVLVMEEMRQATAQINFLLLSKLPNHPYSSFSESSDFQLDLELRPSTLTPMHCNFILTLFINSSGPKCGGMGENKDFFYYPS